MNILLPAAVALMFVGLALILAAKDETSLLYGIAQLSFASFFIVMSITMAVSMALQRLGIGG